VATAITEIHTIHKGRERAAPPPDLAEKLRTGVAGRHRGVQQAMEGVLASPLVTKPDLEFVEQCVHFGSDDTATLDWGAVERFAQIITSRATVLRLAGSLTSAAEHDELNQSNPYARGRLVRMEEGPC